MAPAPPKRILCFAPVFQDTFSYLGLADKVTTAGEYHEDVPFLSEKERPEYWFTMGVERARSQKADLVLTFSSSQQELHKRLLDVGFQALHLDPLSLREVEDSFLQIGRATGTLETALRLAKDFNGGLGALRERVPGGAYRPKLYCEDWDRPPSASGGWYPELMNLLGAHYFPMYPRELSRPVRIEEMVKFDPEIILFVVRGPDLEFNPNMALKRIGWEKIDAVRKKRLYTVKQTLLNRPGPLLVEGAKVVQQILGQSFWGWPLVPSSSARKVVD